MITERLLRDEHWWGGAVADGLLMPFGSRPHRRDLSSNAGSVDDPGIGANQSAPLLVSSAGRYVWSERPFAYAFDGGTLTADGEAEVIVGTGAAPTLRAAFQAAAARFFPANGRTPGPAMFSGPQWNTWIEMPYDESSQDRVLAYARGVVDASFPPGVLMIDDRWSVDYGNWAFDVARFPDPAAMTAELQRLGFHVMVWLVPFVSPDSAISRRLENDGLLIIGADGEPVVRRWWNGWSTMLDLGNPEAVAWLRGELGRLRDLGVDGFKFDAGDVRDWRPGDVSASGGGAVDYAEAWASFAAEFEYNELRACWKAGGRPLAQRLHDKPPSWGRDGLLSLIPEGIAQGLIGHPFNCPDMIGGGELSHFADGVPVGQELFVRFTQCAALFPMMQFSLAPWRLLDAEHLAAVEAAVELRQSLLPEILALVDHAAETGEPILRTLAYHHAGYESVLDQFLLGEDLLVAPVLEPGATTRTVQLPPGRWVAPDGSIVDGPATVEIEVGLDTLPHFRR